MCSATAGPMLIGRMKNDMKRVVVELWQARDPAVGLDDADQAVVLASIVEKETGVAEERPLIAGVFLNRLRQGMRLQADATVIYAVTGGKRPLGRPLSRADLRVESPYNTYRNGGLPPGPIANPGRAALAAVLNPAETDALYFVADGSGGHAFAETLDEHNRNVRALARQAGCGKEEIAAARRPDEKHDRHFQYDRLRSCERQQRRCRLELGGQERERASARHPLPPARKGWNGSTRAVRTAVSLQLRRGNVTVGLRLSQAPDVAAMRVNRAWLDELIALAAPTIARVKASRRRASTACWRCAA